MKQLVEYMKESLATNSPFALNEDRDQTRDSISRKLNRSFISEDSDETIRLNDFEAIWKVKDPENLKGIFVIEVPEDYTDDDINQYISDLLIESMPSDDDLAKGYLGANADKKSIVRLKALAKNERGDVSLRNFGRGTALEIINDDLQFVANVYVASNKDGDRQIFLRQSIISQDKWDYVSKEFNRIGEKINDSESKKPFTFISMFTHTGAVEFFYIIDTDKLIPIYLRHSKNEQYEDDECLSNYSEDDKAAINAICKAINQNHKDI